jgi:DNA-binding GntR family transcriptional regulator
MLDHAHPIDLNGTNYTRVRDIIRDAIIAGTYPPGYRLKVVELTQRYSVSSNPVREALQQLQGEGFVVILPNKGATVRLIDDALLSQIFDIRRALEGLLTARAAERADQPVIDRLLQVQDAMRVAAEADDQRLRHRLNVDFHAILFDLADNPEATQILDRHRSLTRAIRWHFGITPGRPAEVHQEHLAIIDAIARRDSAGAEQAARHHVERASADLMQRFRADR